MHIGNTPRKYMNSQVIHHHHQSVPYPSVLLSEGSWALDQFLLHICVTNLLCVDLTWNSRTWFNYVTNFQVDICYVLITSTCIFHWLKNKSTSSYMHTIPEEYSNQDMSNRYCGKKIKELGLNNPDNSWNKNCYFTLINSRPAIPSCIIASRSNSVVRSCHIR